MKWLNTALLCLFCLTCGYASGLNVRKIQNFGQGWKFNLGDVSNGQQPVFNDASWRSQTLPHDWSIEGKFDPNNPATIGGGALPGGIGWYRKTFTVAASEKDKIVSVDFDGVYCNSEVWINGHYLGKRPYGYSSFRYELTPFLTYGNKKNVIAVKVDNSQQPNSRWYSGSGIYRNVWLVINDKIAVDHWGAYVTTPDVSAESARVNIKTTIRNRTDKNQTIVLTSLIYNAAGKAVGKVSTMTIAKKDSVLEIGQDVTITNPVLWSDTRPYLYKVVTNIETNEKLRDNYETPLGIRSFVFDNDKGFMLNGKSVKIRGVCDHHDLGCLGSAINYRALERQLELLKAMGCNAIRTSHNPPAPELLTLADKIGFIIMDEAFDMWKKPKNKFDYHLVWDEWHERDLKDMILRDRNHPSVFIWSIGNEILEQWDSTGLTIAKELSGIVRSLDKTRPITSACNDPKPNNFIIKSGALDLIGYNYHQDMFPDFKKDFPGQKFIATETTSAFETRGSYDLPSDSIRRWPKDNVPMNKDLSCSSYDNCSAPWGSTHEETLKVMKKYDFLSGMFVWTGFDYLGEPTPYPWPARSSYFGIIDLAGFPKDAYYLYQSEWTSKPVLHLLPHWNWEIGQVVDVWAYTNADDVELLLNGKSLGIKKKTGDELHLIWKVPFVPGVLTAISRTNGKVVLVKEVTTAGSPARIVLIADRKKIKANGTDLSYITVKIVDKNGITVPNAENLVSFNVRGDGFLTAVDNGSPISMESFKADKRKAFHGLCLAVIQSKDKVGKIVVTATSEGLGTTLIELITRK